MKKSEVGYKSANYDQTKFCKSCKFIDLQNDRCEKVEGSISYGYVCKLWQLGNPNASTPPRKG